MATKANWRFHKEVDISSTNFTDEYDGLYITGSGNITIIDMNDVSRTIAIVAPWIHPMGGKQIVKATTTCTGMTAYKYSQEF